MNKRLLENLGINEEDYKQWCQIYHKSSYKKSSKTEFLKRIQEGKIIRNKTGKLIDIKKEK